jgi:hypothetical protein
MEYQVRGPQMADLDGMSMFMEINKIAGEFGKEIDRKTFIDAYPGDLDKIVLD